MNNRINLNSVKVFPLISRASEARLEDILVSPDAEPAACSALNANLIAECAARIRRARDKGAAVMMIYGAHLIKNGGAAILGRIIKEGWVTHLATNGAGVIHDWEFSFFGQSTESVKKNVAAGNFGTWDETGKVFALASLCGGLDDRGLGTALGQFVLDDGVTLPTAESLEKALQSEPSHPQSPARAELLLTMRRLGLPAGRQDFRHAHKEISVLAQARQHNVPLTVHPGIGYDIFTNHPWFNGAALGRAAQVDFELFGGTLEQLDDGVVLSVGSAIMGPQVFEKSLSCVNNLRHQANRAVVKGHTIYVVDLQDGGNWDWRQGEPPKDNPAYYLRFCKSYSRMGGEMRYLQCDNIAFVHHLLQSLPAR